MIICQDEAFLQDLIEGRVHSACLLIHYFCCQPSQHPLLPHSPSPPSSSPSPPPSPHFPLTPFSFIIALKSRNAQKNLKKAFLRGFVSCSLFWEFKYLIRIEDISISISSTFKIQCTPLCLVESSLRKKEDKSIFTLKVIHF